jgi:hypothetical protein
MSALKLVICYSLLVTGLFLAPATSADHLTTQQACDPTDDHCTENLSCQQATINLGTIAQGEYGCFDQTDSSVNTDDPAPDPSVTTITTPSSTNTPSTTKSVDCDSPTTQPLNEECYNHQLHYQVFIEDGVLSGLYALGGICLTDNGKCLGKQVQQTADGKLQFNPVAMSGGANQGALVMAGSLMASLYNSPTSTTAYLANIGQNLGIAPKEAYANHAGVLSVGGSGEGIIHPIIQLWQVSRNIAYAGFIIIFVVAGFMIMFRSKVNSQTVASAQQALPGLVIGIILVTFSYFIASLLIDLAFVGTRLVAELFTASGMFNIYSPTGTSDVVPVAQNSNAFQLFGTAGIRVENIGDIFDGTKSTVDSGGDKVAFILPSIIFGLIAGLIGFFFFGPLGAILLGGGAAALGGTGGALTGGLGSQPIVAGIASLIIPLILLIALMFQFIRLLLILIGTYIQLLVYTILGPFFIMFSAIPGRGGTLTSWMKTIAANALIFPAVFAMFMFAGVVLGTPANIWQNATLPLFGGLSVELIRLILAYGILLGIPAIPEMVKQAFGVKGPEGIAKTAIASFASGQEVVGGGVERGYKTAYTQTGLAARQEGLHRYEMGRYETQLGNPATRWSDRFQRFIRFLPSKH